MENCVYGKKAKRERQRTICGINNKYKIQSGFGMCERELMSVLIIRDRLIHNDGLTANSWKITMSTMNYSI